MADKQYICLDQKSFYATVECVARGLDPMTTDLVVADPERSQNTICLAVVSSITAKPRWGEAAALRERCGGDGQPVGRALVRSRRNARRAGRRRCVLEVR